MVSVSASEYGFNTEVGKNETRKSRIRFL